MATRHRRLSSGLLIFTLALFFSSPSSASAILYGDFGPDLPSGTVMYQDVQENSYTDPGPLYGAPSLGGNLLDFDPSAFAASGLDGGLDITDAQLNLTMMIVEIDDSVASGLQSLQISESGDYSLLGLGTAVSSVSAALSVLVHIFEVDGAAITPIETFASVSLARDLSTHGPAALAPWALSLMIDFDALLGENQVEFELGVTKAELAIDNQLVAISERGSVSFIAKKDLMLQPTIRDGFPISVAEPSAALLLAPLLLLVARAGQRKA